MSKITIRKYNDVQGKDYSTTYDIVDITIDLMHNEISFDLLDPESQEFQTLTYNLGDRVQ